MLIAIYAIWFILNFTCIFIGDTDTDYFFPRKMSWGLDWDLDYYDFGEFCVYALLIPAIIVGIRYIYKLVKEK